MGWAIVSPRLRREPFAADHTRARELAAQRVDGPIGPDDTGWLNDHLAWCGPCRAVAAEYDEQRLALRALRFDEPVPPRDLWARTAAKIEAEPSPTTTREPRRRTGFGVYASLTGALIVARRGGRAWSSTGCCRRSTTRPRAMSPSPRRSTSWPARSRS